MIVNVFPSLTSNVPVLIKSLLPSVVLTVFVRVKSVSTVNDDVIVHQSVAALIVVGWVFADALPDKLYVVACADNAAKATERGNIIFILIFILGLFFYFTTGLINLEGLLNLLTKFLRASSIRILTDFSSSTDISTNLLQRVAGNSADMDLLFLLFLFFIFVF